MSKNTLSDNRILLSNRPSPDLLILGTLFSFGFGLRLLYLYRLDVWFDEVVLLFQLDKSYLNIWNFCKMDNFPPLFPWLIKLWYSIFPSEHSLRIFCALSGAIAPPAAYLLGKEIGNRKVGLLIGSACVISAPMIYYSQMIRMYCLLPLWGLLSLLYFFRGVRTAGWKNWMGMSIANLLGFYTFMTFIFLIAAEFITLLWFYRRELKRLIKPIIAHIPTFLLILLWMGSLLTRYHQIQGSFWLEEVSGSDWVKLWLFLGTGTDFNNRFVLAFLLNFPLLCGLIFSLFAALRSQTIRIGLILFLLTVVMMFVASKFGQPIFFKRYLFFLLPLYLCLVLAGMDQFKNSYRKIGITLIFIPLLLTLGYYYYQYNEYHSEWVFSLPAAENNESDGHAISNGMAWLDGQVKPGEVIIHFSSPPHRCFSFFPSLYYSRKPELSYIFSSKPIPQHFGQQYLKPGQWIQSLSQLTPPPSGFWLVSLDDVESIFAKNYSGGYGRGLRWVSEDDLPRELRSLGFEQIGKKQFGRLLFLHFTRSYDPDFSIPISLLRLTRPQFDASVS